MYILLSYQDVMQNNLETLVATYSTYLILVEWSELKNFGDHTLMITGLNFSRRSLLIRMGARWKLEESVEIRCLTSLYISNVMDCVHP